VSQELPPLSQPVVLAKVSDEMFTHHQQFECASFNTTVAIVPSLEAGDILLMHGVTEHSTRDEPRPSSEVAPPTTVSQLVSLAT